MRFLPLILLLVWSAKACEHMDTVPVLIRYDKTGKVDKPYPVQIDRCLAPIIEALQAAGIATITSCCNHGLGNGYIQLKDRVLIVTPKTTPKKAEGIYLREFDHIGLMWWEREMKIKREQE